MKNWKKYPKRMIAFLLIAILTVNTVDISAMSVFGAQNNEQTTNGTDTTFDTNTQNSTDEVVVYEEFIDLGTVETSAPSISFFGTTSSVTLKDGNYIKWIDRINVPDYAIELYNKLVEGADNDGVDDILIEDKYFSESATPIVVTTSETLASPDEVSVLMSEISVIVRNVFDAFDRDHPEVFWLSGLSGISCSYSGSPANGYVATFYLRLKDSGIDVRETEYQSESAIKSAIATRDSAINTILSGMATANNTVKKMKYFNDWLTKHNQYNTIVAGNGTGPSSAHECL